MFIYLKNWQKGKIEYQNGKFLHGEHFKFLAASSLYYYLVFLSILNCWPTQKLSNKQKRPNMIKTFFIFWFWIQFKRHSFQKLSILLLNIYDSPLKACPAYFFVAHYTEQYYWTKWFHIWPKTWQWGPVMLSNTSFLFAYTLNFHYIHEVKGFHDHFHHTFHQ